MTANPSSPVLLTIDGIRSRYGISRSVAYNLLGEGAIEARKLGRRLLIVRSSVDNYVANLPPADIRPGRRSRRRDAQTGEGA